MRCRDNEEFFEALFVCSVCRICGEQTISSYLNFLFIAVSFAHFALSLALMVTVGSEVLTAVITKFESPKTRSREFG
jgi:hypothetical protein